MSAATALLLTAGGSALAATTGLPTAPLLAVGLALVPWVAYLSWVATRRSLPAAAVWAVIALNGVWVVDCALVALGLFGPLTAAGVTFATAQASGTLLLAVLEWIGLRRSAPAAA